MILLCHCLVLVSGECCFKNIWKDSSSVLRVFAYIIFSGSMDFFWFNGFLSVKHSRFAILFQDVLNYEFNFVKRIRTI